MSVTGFFFPFNGITPAMGLEIVSLAALGLAIRAHAPKGLFAPTHRE